MILHRYSSGSASHNLRVVGALTAYGVVLVTGTALLIGAFGGLGTATPPEVQQPTAAEIVLQRTAERGVQAPEAFLLASRNIPNDKRGF